MELPHWLMIGGAFLLVAGSIGSAMQRNVQVTSDPDSREADQPTEAQASISLPAATAAS